MVSLEPASVKVCRGQMLLQFIIRILKRKSRFIQLIPSKKDWNKPADCLNDSHILKASGKYLSTPWDKQFPVPKVVVQVQDSPEKWMFWKLVQEIAQWCLLYWQPRAGWWCGVEKGVRPSSTVGRGKSPELTGTSAHCTWVGQTAMALVLDRIPPSSH